MRILLMTPPMTQINSPYPATPYLKSFLEAEGHTVMQMDGGLELFLRLFSKNGLAQVENEIRKKTTALPEGLQFFLEAADDYKRTIDPVVRFLQGKDPSLALRIAEHKLVPEGPRFVQFHQHKKQIRGIFGPLGSQDLAKHIASLYIDDIADYVKIGIDPIFEFSRYGESLASSQASFNQLYGQLQAKPSLVQKFIDIILEEVCANFEPELIAFTVPFPGNLFAALKMGQWLRLHRPKCRILMGGGFINTELRQLSDPRIFEFIDALTYDDGELPLRQLLAFYEGKLSEAQLCRTKMLKNGKVETFDDKKLIDIAFAKRPRPSFKGLRLRDYVSMLELPNPVHRLWSDFRWNKIVLAHGCYWKKCTFCDVSLDYIGKFEPHNAKNLVDHIEEIIQETGSTGFHFVDEAAPPALLRAMSKEIIARGLTLTWWGNLRFDVQFDAELCQLMSEAGCVAVTGGIEVASPRLLDLIKKGVTLEQVAQVTKNFSESGIFVHAYLMYGFPTQTEQETVDSLEIVRQLFRSDCLQSAHWHRFLATVHSPVGLNPKEFSLRLEPAIEPTEGLFAQYSVPFVEQTSVDHEMLGRGLRKALYNYMHGLGLHEDVHTWFERKVRRSKVPKNWIRTSLSPSSSLPARQK